MSFNKLKKKVCPTAFIQEAKWTKLGYLVESTNQRKIAGDIVTGKETPSDSPQDMRVLYGTILNHLKKNATVADNSCDLGEHNYSVFFITRSQARIKMSDSFGFLEIEVDSKGKDYLVSFLENNSFSVDTTKAAYGG